MAPMGSSPGSGGPTVDPRKGCPSRGRAGRTRSLLKSIRFYTSLASTMVFNMGAFGVFLKKAPCPGFNCHGCPWATAACPVGVVSFGLSVRALPALAIGAVLAIGAAVGRLVCAFACPFGLLQELLYRFPTRKFELPRWTRYVKYAALALLVVLLPYLLGFEGSTGLRLYYCKLCPKGTLTATLPSLLGGSTTDVYAAAGGLVVRFGIAAFFLVLMVLVSRGFCRTFCPLGAMYGLASYLAVWRVRVDETACTACGLCNKACPVGLDVRSEVGGAECISCGECIQACPKGAIKRSFGL